MEISNRKWIFRCITQERNLGISSIYIRKLNHGNPEDYSLITACKRKRKKGSRAETLRTWIFTRWTKEEVTTNKTKRV